MPARPTKGKAQMGTQVDTEILAAFKAYAAGRGETLTHALERAMRREMAYPPAPPAPPPPLEPLPDSPAAKGKRK